MHYNQDQLDNYDFYVGAIDDRNGELLLHFFLMLYM